MNRRDRIHLPIPHPMSINDLEYFAETPIPECPCLAALYTARVISEVQIVMLLPTEMNCLERTQFFSDLSSRGGTGSSHLEWVCSGWTGIPSLLIYGCPFRRGATLANGFLLCVVC